ncbi:hypothetical protein [Methylobacterium durans]|nr:hypothetical protein [Methylobacterium durans]
MLGKLKSLTGIGASGTRAQHEQSAEPFQPDAFEFPPMKPLSPPAAENDDLMRPVYEAVEQDLRSAGLLR